MPSQFLVPNELKPDGTISSELAANTALLTQMVTNPFRNVPGYEGTALFTSTQIQRQVLLRPFPQFCNATCNNSASVLSSNNDGKSWYHSGQFTIQKRFSHGYTVQAAYTWSKWLQATEYLNTGDEKPTKMISDQDTPHRFSLSGIYALPFGKGQPFLSGNGVLDRIVGGWQIQGVYSFQVGFPIAFGAYNITSGATSGDIFFLGGDVALPSSQQDTKRWFNTAAFSQVAPTAGHLRTLPYRFADVRRDNINNVDISLMKNTRITESTKIQFRLEAINALNHPYFQAPSTAIGSAFGSIASSTANQANYARRIQIGIKFLF